MDSKRKNWVDGLTDREDDIEEKILNGRLENLIKKYEEKQEYGNLSKTEEIKLLEEMLEVYASLRKQHFDYSQEEYAKTKEDLQKAKYEYYKQKQQQTEEAKSWNDYREEEGRNEDEER